MRDKNAGTLELSIKRVAGSESTDSIDVLSVEEPLEIRITHEGHDGPARSLAVTMRTPGHDEELATGFLYTEGIVSSIDQILGTKRIGCNVVEVRLSAEVTLDDSQVERHSFVASSCGVCGKRTIEAVKARRAYSPVNPFPAVLPEVIHELPEKLRSSQPAFGTTGGIHACAIFDLSGRLILTREDIGRHNAMDKLIGACARSGDLPLENRIVLVSGRASFELVQKAAHAGATIMAAVGAPSSLAVELAQNSGMTLLGFVRNNRFNIYTPGFIAEPAAKCSS